MEEEATKRFEEARKRLVARENEHRAQLEGEVRAIRERAVRRLTSRQ